jgi:hypothetical protein
MGSLGAALTDSEVIERAAHRFKEREHVAGLAAFLNQPALPASSDLNFATQSVACSSTSTG